MRKHTTLYIAIGALILIAIFSFITYNKDKKIKAAQTAATKAAAEAQRQQKIADNASISVNALADLISKQMNQQKDIHITY